MLNNQKVTVMSKLLFIINWVFIGGQQVLTQLLLNALFKREVPSGKQASNNILVLKMGGLGDFLFGLPAFQLLKSEQPNSKIVLLTQVSFGGVHLDRLAKKKLLSLPWLDLVDEIFESRYVINGLSYKSMRELRRTLSNYKFDTIISMPHPGEPFFTTLKKIIFLRFLGLGACVVFGARQNYSTAFFRKFHSEWGLAVHKIQGPWRAVEEFLSEKHTITDELLMFPERKFSKIDVRQLLTEIIQDYDAYITISPGATADWKSWGFENYRDLISTLHPELKKRKICIILTGPSSDSSLGHSLELGANVFSFIGKFTITELAAIQQNAICTLGADGGAVHLAAFSGAQVISLSNGAEEPGVVTPVGPKVLEHRNLTSCTPCFGMTFCAYGHAKCLKDINVSAVMDSIIHIVDSIETQG
jgi:ADP-heptose:LPS heptosyltransferase